MTKGKEGSGSKRKVPISMKHVTGGGRYPSALLGVSSPWVGKVDGVDLGREQWGNTSAPLGAGAI